MSLQKVTELDPNVQEIFKLDKITAKDFDNLTEKEKDQYFAFSTEQINSLEGEERDRFIDKLDLIMSNKTRNEIWELNHIKIIQEITSCIEQYGRMPTKLELASLVGLSRQTLHKHLKEYKDNPLYNQHIDQFQFMSQKLLAKMFQFAIKGDVKAGRLYFDMVGHLGPQKVKNQTNYIQVNNLIIREDELKALTSDQLSKLESVLTELKM
jgi:DNA-binding protein Fis